MHAAAGTTAGDGPWEAALETLLRAQQAPLSWHPDARRLIPRETRRCVAVDGSHAVLVQTGAVWVVAVRAAAVAWPGPRREVPVAVHATLPDEAEGLVAAMAARLGLPAPTRLRTADAFAEAVRSMAEAEAAQAALLGMGEDDLLLMDGALTGQPPGPQAATDAVVETAAHRGVPVLGVSKRSGLSDGGVPIVPRLAAAVEEAAPWAVPVPGHSDVWVCRLHRRAPWAFRVDGREDHLGRLVLLARDAAYPGYPYPLAVAHNAVALTAAHVATERARLEAAVRRRGGGQAWAWLQDFHTVLDRNVPG